MRPRHLARGIRLGAPHARRSSPPDGHRRFVTKALYSHLLGEALQFAADAFRDRSRKGSGVPYLTHLLQVCAWVGEYGGDEEQMSAAVLHDYLEDIDPK